MTDTEKWGMIYNYVVSQCRAVLKGDFANYIQSQEYWGEFIGEKKPDDIVTVTETGLTIPADLVALIKQALIEYSEETNGFYLLPTTDYRTVPVEHFVNYSQYKTFKNIVEEQGVVASWLGWGYEERQLHFINCFSDPDDHVSLVGESGMVNKLKNTPWAPVGVTFYGTYDWQVHAYKSLHFPDFTETEKVYKSLSEATEYQGSSNYMNAITGGSINFDFNQCGSYDKKRTKIIYSTTGERIRVFVSANAMKNYTAGQRTVYFGKGFYDYQPADITVTWDEINDRIAHIDDILQQLLDKITDADDEDAIEDLLQQILDAIQNGGDKDDDKNDNDDKNNSNNKYDDSNLLSTLSGYFSDVLGYLADIAMSVKGLVWIEADKELDKDKTDLFDLIDKIWKNPETGSQEAADTLSGSFAEIASGITKKFPFSIPWDIYALFTVFSGTPPPDTAEYRTVTLGVQPFTVDNEDLEQDIHEAPYFVLPLRVDSWRIYEEVVIDLKDFKTVSTLSRGLLAVLFGVFLIKFTIRIIELFKGGTDD